MSGSIIFQRSDSQVSPAFDSSNAGQNGTVRESLIPSSNYAARDLPRQSSGTAESRYRSSQKASHLPSGPVLSVPRQRSRPASWALAYTSGSRASSNPQSTPSSIPENASRIHSEPKNLARRTLSQRIRSPSENTTGLNQKPQQSVASDQRSTTPGSFSYDDDSLVNDSNTMNVAFSSRIVQPRTYKHYFSVATEKQSGSSNVQQGRQEPEARKIRRIRPSSTRQPTLVLADSILVPGEVDKIMQKKAGALRLESKHISPGNSTQYTSSPVESEGIPSEKGSRRSFSISDILSRNMSFRRTSEDRVEPRSRLPRPLSQRITSAPLSGESRSRMTKYDGKPMSDERMEAMRLAENNKRRSVSGPAMQPMRGFDESQFSVTPNHQSSVAQNRSSTSKRHHHSPIDLSSPELPSSLGPNQRAQHSATPSELTSSQLGSEAGARVFSLCDGDDGDGRSETIYDSVRTDTLLKRETFPGSLFDEDPSIERLPAHVPSLSRSFLDNSATTMKNHTQPLEEEGAGFPTPSRTRTTNDVFIDGPGNPPYPASSPPMLSGPLTLRKMNWDSGDDDDPFGWSGDNEADVVHPIEHHNAPQHDSMKDLMRATNLSHSPLPEEPSGRTPVLENDSEAKMNVFDWSEQPQVERVSSTGLPRPKTIHGKKNRDIRVSRTNGRRAPSGPHARSQSVPALSDQNDNRVGTTSKFGTWGIGTKGATEDWDDDFDFSGQTLGPSPEDDAGESGRIVEKAILIPQTIREQQTNVLANIGLLKEWGILIEELKELRLRATMLGLDADMFQSTFDEVDAMIDLADQESEETKDVDPSPAPSPMPDFESEEQDQFSMDPTSVNRASQLPPDSVTRPRKNSEAIALSVIQAIQQRRSPPVKTPHQSPRKPKAKVPFDKGTLKHILPHLSNLVKSMKKILRDAEGFSTSPEQRSRRPQPALSQAFVAPTERSPTLGGRNTLQLDYDPTDEDWGSF